MTSRSIGDAKIDPAAVRADPDRASFFKGLKRKDVLRLLPLRERAAFALDP